MTTAPDLPVSTAVPHQAAQPSAPLDHPSLGPIPALDRPALALVPSRPLEGEEIELDEALRRAGPRLKRYAVRRLHDEHESEEVVQEALLRAYQNRHILATEDDLMAWLTVVTGRLVIDRLRVRGRSTPVAELPPASRASRDTADVVVARDEARIALDALESMPGRQASVLWAREVEGLSYDDIGERFGMSEPSVRSLLHRARKTLRREYAARGGTLPGVGLVALAPWLIGLRAAGKLRHVAKRGASAAAVAATGLAVMTVVPFSTPHSPVTSAPDTSPAVRIKATQVALPHHHASHHVARAHTAAAPSAATIAPAHGAPTGPTAIHGPSVCGTHTQHHGIDVGCGTTHRAPTLYVKLPVTVAGKDEVGLSNDGIVAATCDTVPSTLVVECDDSSASSPSKGKNS